MNVIKQYFKEFNTGTKTMFKEFFKKDTNKKQRANMWTFSRLVTAGIIPVLITIGVLTNSMPILITAFAGAGFGALTDFIDGKSARKHNSSSEFGALLDAVSDKAYTTLLSVGLSVLNPAFIMNIIGELAITITNGTYKIKHEELKMESTKLGKIKQWPLSTTFILGILSILYPGLTTLTNIAIITTFAAQLGTVISYIESNEKQLKEINEKKTEYKEQAIEKTKELDQERQKRLEELIKLRNVLNNILDEEIKKEETNPKTRKRTIQ